MRTPERELTDDSMAALLGRWMAEMREIVLERAPSPADEQELLRQLAAAAGERERGDRHSRSGREVRGGTMRHASFLPLAALALWRLLHAVVEEGLDLFGEEDAARSILAEQIEPASRLCGADQATLLDLAREFLAADRPCPVTPAAFGARLRRQPQERMELPDGVTLSGASLAAFLESGHFPFGQYRIGEECFFVTPSLRLGAEELEAMVRQGPGRQRVGRELLVWQPTSFRVAAGTAAEARDARPFVGPSGARAYLWLGPVLPGGPLVLRDANNAEARVSVPVELFYEADRRQSADSSLDEEGHEPKPASQDGRCLRPLTPSPPHPLRPRHPALIRAEEALERGEHAVVERHLREVMSSPQASGETLSGVGRLWQALGRLDVASAAFTMALERGSVEGALGLSQLAEAMGEGIEAAARPLDAAVARNLRSAELHARYAELLARLPAGWEGAAQVEWHRRRAEDLKRSER